MDLLLFKAGYFPYRAINYSPNDQKWLSQVLLSRNNLSGLVFIRNCNPTTVERALSHCATSRHLTYDLG